MKRKIDSYKKGDVVNGIEFIKHVTYGSHRTAMFKCPECMSDWTTRFCRVRSRKASMCKKCSSRKNQKKMINHKNTKYSLFKRKGVCKPQENDPEKAKRRMFMSYKGGAKNRGYSFLISFDFFKKTIMSDCFYCGSEPSMKKSTKSNYHYFVSNGVDRVDNKVGYEEFNCVSCCKICNRAKNDMKYTDFMEWIDRIVNFKNIKKEGQNG